MKKNIILIAITSLCFAAWLLLRSEEEPQRPIAETGSRPTQTTKPQTALTKPVTGKKKIKALEPTLRPIVGVAEIHEEDILLYLARHKRSAEALAFAATLYQPINPMLVEEAMAKGPTSEAVIAAELKMLRHASISAYFSGDKQGSMQLKHRLDELIQVDPRNGYYRLMMIVSAMDRNDYLAIPDLLTSLPWTDGGSKPDLASGNLASLYRELMKDFITHEIQTEDDTGPAVQDGFTGGVVSDPLQAVKGSFIATRTDEATASRTLASTIALARYQSLAEEDIDAYSSALQGGEMHLLEKVASMKKGKAIIDGALPVPFPSHMAELREKLAKALIMKNEGLSPPR